VCTTCKTKRLVSATSGISCVRPGGVVDRNVLRAVAVGGERHRLCGNARVPGGEIFRPHVAPERAQAGAESGDVGLDAVAGQLADEPLCRHA
jgi:hypothetical protein